MEISSALIVVALFGVLMWLIIFDTSPYSVCDSYPNIGKVVDELGIGHEEVNAESANKIAKHVGYPEDISPTNMNSDTLRKLDNWILANYIDGE